jgi:cation diffusion facilitator family transporter
MWSLEDDCPGDLYCLTRGDATKIKMERPILETERQPILVKSSTRAKDVHIIPIPQKDPIGLYNYIKSEAEIAKLKNAATRQFYRTQNDKISILLAEPSHQSDPEEQEMTQTRLKIAVYASTIANGMLFVMQSYGAWATGSLSLLATCADAFMDLLSSVVLLVSGYTARHANYAKYPIGTERTEPLGVVVFATLMSTVAIQLMVEGGKSLYAGPKQDSRVDTLATIFVVVALVMKVILLIYCLTLKEFLSARTLAQDHRNDIIINGFGLAMSLSGTLLAWYWDPIGAILVGLFILWSWGNTAMEQVVLLIGSAAPDSITNYLTYQTLTFDERILAVDTVRSFSVGNKYMAEIDIILPKTMSVEESHDIAQALQDFIEELPSIERAYVHIDYEADHRPEHTAEAREEFRQRQ